MTPHVENRWEFPKIRLVDEADCGKEDLKHAAESGGLHGTILCGEPLGSFVASRQNETRSMVGFLMHVDDVDESWPRQESHRRLWCLPEEARLRIRRKPLRRFIDLALQSMKQVARDADRSASS